MTSQLTELLERLRRGPEVIETAIRNLADAELDYSPAPDKWTVRQILAHLADAEMVGADRLRRVIAEDNPTLMNYDEAAWARKLDYDRRGPMQALELFRLTRAANYDLLKRLPESTFDRSGTHSRMGALSLRQLLQIYADHAENHARQIRSVREQYGLNHAARASR